MIAKAVRFFANRPYSIEYRRFAKNPNPTKQARILAQIGVLQLPLIVFLFLCALFNPLTSKEEPMVSTLKIESSAFANHTKIPSQYTCEGKDRSPPLKFSGIPAKAKSLALIVDDPDAPMGTFDHWIAWNIPPSKTELPEGAAVPKQGMNGFGVTHYRGPCPPRGAPHRYYFKLYALDTMLDLEEGSSKQELLDAMQGHILGQGELVGIFQR